MGALLRLPLAAGVSLSFLGGMSTEQVAEDGKVGLVVAGKSQSP